jgi:hypothetical protein
MTGLSNAHPRFHPRSDLCCGKRSGRLKAIPVENGPNKRGGRLPDFAGYCSVLPLGYKMSWVLRRARAVDLISTSEFSKRRL